MNDEIRPADREPDAAPPSRDRSGKRPFLERLGLAAIALVLGVLFVIVACAGYAGGELFIAAMGAIGALMTLWVGLLTLVRG